MDSAIDRTLQYNIINNTFNNNTDLSESNLSLLLDKIYDIVSISIEDNVTKDYIKERLIKIRKYQDQLNNLKKIPVIEQRTEEWYNIRQKLISASDFGQAINRGEYGNQRDFLIKKIEGKSKEISYKKPLLWGIKYEDVAIAIYCKRNNVYVHEFGLIKHPNLDYIGASPDGISNLGIMLEIKCPYSRKINGKIIEQYYDQIQGQLEVCDLYECDFLECEFKEYKNESEFIQDNKNLNEKGIIIQYRNNSEEDYKYLYSPLDISINEMITWKNTNIEQFDITIDFRIDYWYIKKYNNQRVYRDKEYFNKINENLKYIWDKITYFKSNNKEYLKYIVNNKKSKIYDFNTRKNEVILNGYAFKNIKSDYN